LASLLTVAYFLRLQRKVFFGKLAEGLSGLTDAKCWILVPAIVLAIITVGIGLGFPWLFETFLMPIRSIL
jgi:multicomponent Na+:H+ antiporter subunit D